MRATGSSDQLNYSLRGQSVDSFSFAAPAVVAYFNEVPTGGAAAQSFFAMDSIQVLKGPQGTLFGRNATGGAVNFYTRSPSLTDYDGYVTAGAGNYSLVTAQGAIGGPIVGAVMAVWMVWRLRFMSSVGKI